MTRREGLNFHIWALLTVVAVAGLLLFFGNWWTVGQLDSAVNLGPGILGFSYARMALGFVLLVIVVLYGLYLHRRILAPHAALRSSVARVAAGHYRHPTGLSEHAVADFHELQTHIAILVQALQQAIDRADLEGETNRTAFAGMVAALEDAAHVNREFRALTERLEAEVAERTKELAHRQAFTESLVDHIPAAVAFLDPTLVYRWNNAAHCAFLGLPPERIIGRNVFDVVPANRKALEPIYRQLLDTGEPFSATDFPLVMCRNGKDTPTFWDLRYLPIREDGVITGILVVASEVSERVERDRLKDQFLSMLSHELRTPINAVMGFGSVLDDERVGPLNPEQHRYIRKMLAGSEALLSLVNDLLDMGRIEAGKFTLSPSDIALDSVVERVLENLAPLAEQRDHTLSAAMAPDLPRVYADDQRVGQVLINLVNNAIKFTPPGGTITVRAYREQNFIRCEVEDNGPGISQADMERLFQHYGQLPGQSRRPHESTGLGLSISKAIVEAHGGTIGVHSQPGRGSTFWFSLPVHEPASVKA